MSARDIVDSCTGCGRHLTVLSIGDLCRPCHRSRHEPTPAAEPPTTTSTVDFQDSGVRVAPPTSVVSASVGGATDASFTARASGSTSVSTNAPKGRRGTMWAQYVEDWKALGRPDVSIPLEHVPAGRDPFGHMRRLVEFLEHGFGLRDANGEDRPWELGQDFLAAETGIPAATASRLLARLSGSGAIHRCHKGARNRTQRVVHTYLPGVATGCEHCGGLGAEAPVIELEALAVDVEPAAGRERVVQPGFEHCDHEPVQPAHFDRRALEDLVGDPGRRVRPDRPPRRVPASPRSAPAHAAKPSRGDGWDLDYLASLEPEPER